MTTMIITTSDHINDQFRNTAIVSIGKHTSNDDDEAEDDHRDDFK